MDVQTYGTLNFVNNNATSMCDFVFVCVWGGWGKALYVCLCTYVGSTCMKQNCK